MHHLQPGRTAACAARGWCIRSTSSACSILISVILTCVFHPSPITRTNASQHLGKVGMCQAHACGEAAVRRGLCQKHSVRGLCSSHGCFTAGLSRLPSLCLVLSRTLVLVRRITIASGAVHLWSLPPAPYLHLCAGVRTLACVSEAAVTNCACLVCCGDSSCVVDCVCGRDRN